MEGNIPHKCLRTADIQALIFSQLTRHDCVQLSRTCISFYDQAMNVVWTEATSIVSLVRCMPRDALREFSTSYEGSQSWLNEYCTIIEFDRDPTPEDWRAFCKHAHRVKKFTEKDSIHLQSGNKQYPYPGPQYDLTPSARELVSRFICQSAAESGFSGLFPYARVLEAISFRNVSFPTYLPYLCGAGLQSFTLNFGLSDSEVENDEVYCDPSHLLPALRARWPNLHSIKISAYISSEPSQAEDYVEAICTWITDLPHLQSFQADVSGHFSLIQVLSDLPLLRNMKLKGHNKATPHVVPDSFISSQGPRFRSLKELSLFTFNPDSPIPILRALKASRTLTHVDLVFFYAHSAPGSVTEAPAAIEAISHLPSLESLDIHFANSEFSPETPSSVPVLSRPLLLPLFGLHKLRLLKLHGFFDIFISDEELRDVVAAWPQLESIDIKADDENTPFMVDHAPLTSLLGVQALYNGCPHLTKAALPVNDVLPMTGGKLDLPDARPRDFAMKELDLRFCPIDFEGFEHGSAEFMPMVIRVLFPRLENLKSCHDDVDVWTSVEDVDWAKQVQNDWKIYRDMEMAEVKQLLERKWEELSAEDQ